MNAGTVIVTLHHALMGVLLLLLCPRVEHLGARFAVAFVGAAGALLGGFVLVGMPLGLAQ